MDGKDGFDSYILIFFIMNVIYLQLKEWLRLQMFARSLKVN